MRIAYDMLCFYATEEFKEAKKNSFQVHYMGVNVERVTEAGEYRFKIKKVRTPGQGIVIVRNTDYGWFRKEK